MTKSFSLFSTLETYKSKIKLPASFLPDLQTTTLSLCPHGAFLQARSWCLFPSFGILAPPLCPHTTSIASFKALSLNAVTLGLRASIYKWCGYVIQSIPVGMWINTSFMRSSLAICTIYLKNFYLFQSFNFGSLIKSVTHQKYFWSLICPSQCLLEHET